IASISDSVERFEHRGPVRRAVKQRAECLERMVRPLLRKLLQMNVLNPIAEDIDPMLGELKEHDVAGVEMDPQIRTLKAIDKIDHLRRRHQIAVEEDVLDVQMNLQPLGL